MCCLPRFQSDIARAKSSIEEMRAQKTASTERVSGLKDEKRRMEEQLGGLRIELSKVKGDPDRITKQTQTVVKACSDMDSTIRGLEVSIKQCDDAIKDRTATITSLEAERKAVEAKLEEHVRCCCVWVCRCAGYAPHGSAFNCFGLACLPACLFEFPAG